MKVGLLWIKGRGFLMWRNEGHMLWKWGWGVDGGEGGGGRGNPMWRRRRLLVEMDALVWRSK